jgi:SAM-dependent methyltransferase
MSTIWYGRHCGEVHAVEDDPEWHRVVSLRAGSASVYCAPDEDAYVDKIREFPRAHFDLIVIDGSHRYGCFQAAPAYLKPGGLLLIDNSDKDRTTQGDLWLIDRDLDRSESAYEVLRFTGWAPGNFFPQETTVVTCRR